MKKNCKIAVIIPAYNEASSIGKVISEIPDWVDEICVADNGSKDKTRQVAEDVGAKVITEYRRGYGIACQTAIRQLNMPDIVVFLDGDYSDFPAEMDRLADPIISQNYELVLGSRVMGEAEKGALSPQARFGNWLACTLIYLIWKVRYTDLGPFRAIRYNTLLDLDMKDPDYGWTVEMQIKAILKNVRISEVPVSYRKRIGKSKVSGTLRGILGAGYKILSIIIISGLRYYFPHK